MSEVTIDQVELAERLAAALERSVVAARALEQAWVDVPDEDDLNDCIEQFGKIQQTLIECNAEWQKMPDDGELQHYRDEFNSLAQAMPSVGSND